MPASSPGSAERPLNGGLPGLPGSLAELAKLFPATRLLTDRADRLAYGTDNSRLMHPPDAVVLPENESEAAAAVRIARKYKVPVLPRGRGTSTTGASLAERGGITVATDRMVGLLEVSAASRSAKVSPGILNGQLQSAAAEVGMFWPPDPSSAAFCTVGGNLATAAAGLRGLRHGGTRENVLGLRAVTGAGEVVRCGADCEKSVAGYDLARLIIGSEGTLALITEATLRLRPLPGARCAQAAGFSSSSAALNAVGELLAGAVTPGALEFLDEGCVALVEGEKFAPDKAAALLLVETEGKTETQARDQMDDVLRILDSCAGFAGCAARKGAGIWKARSTLSQRMRESASLKINEDIAVPTPKMAGLVELASRCCREAGIGNLNFGHAGAGNLHVNLLLDANDAKAKERARGVLDAIFCYAVENGGSISGEHGIGIAKRAHAGLQVDKATARLMTGIKSVFDPDGIMNPGKILPGLGIL